jgi:hypothetical protein
MVFKRYLGIDPGRQGALGVIRPGVGGQPAIVQVHDMPDEQDRGVNLADLDAILSHIPADGTLACLEWPTARPGEVPDFAMRFGQQCGELRALLWARGYETRLIPPQTWTGRLGLPGKQHAGAVVQRAAMWDQRYPHFMAVIRGPRGGLLDGRIDALLIAEFCRGTDAGQVGTKGGRRPPKFFGAV